MAANHAVFLTTGMLRADLFLFYLYHTLHPASQLRADGFIMLPGVSHLRILLVDTFMRVC